MSEPTRTALAWAARQWDAAIERAEPLRGGWTSTMLLLSSDDGRRSVLRLMDKEPWRTHAPQLLARESTVQERLAGSGIPVPRSLAIDPTGADAGTPAHLMSWLPGVLELARADDDLLRRLAELLVSIHAVEPGAARPRDYQSWATPAKRVVPGWARRPDLWIDGFAALDRPPPAYAGTFLHRDFHLGNVLWRDGVVTGVVDWVETSWGPARLDVAHARTYLAMLHGPGAAVRFEELYDGLVASTAHTAYWDVMDVVGYLPDPTKVVQPWRDHGLAISDGLARDRLEEHLAAVLEAT